MKTKSTPKLESQAIPVEQDEPTFRYTLELVATVAANLVTGDANYSAAASRAIKLLDAVSKTIEAETIILGGRKKAERLAKEIQERFGNSGDDYEKTVSFAEGIRYITGKATEALATKPFRDYLRVKLRLSALRQPRRLTDEQTKAVLEPLAEGKAKEAEDQKISEMIALYRHEGFSRHDLVEIKQAWDHLNRNLIRPYQSSKKGKMGGRPDRSSKKT